mgnify:CR=1 FL=1
MSKDKEAEIAFYREMWNDVRHSDYLDWRIMVVLIPIYTSIFGIMVFMRQVLPQYLPESLTALQKSGFTLWIPLLLIGINSSLVWYGMWMTLRSYGVMISALISIQNVEEALQVHKHSFREIDLPKCKQEFVIKFLKSRRCPLFITYTVSLFFSLPITGLIVFENLGFWVGLLLWILFFIVTLIVQSNDYVKSYKNWIKRHTLSER